jgi:hypothetical protein
MTRDGSCVFKYCLMDGARNAGLDIAVLEPTLSYAAVSRKRVHDGPGIDPACLKKQIAKLLSAVIVMSHFKSSQKSTIETLVHTLNKHDTQQQHSNYASRNLHQRRRNQGATDLDRQSTCSNSWTTTNPRRDGRTSKVQGASHGIFGRLAS